MPRSSPGTGSPPSQSAEGERRSLPPGAAPATRGEAWEQSGDAATGRGAPPARLVAEVAAVFCSVLCRRGGSQAPPIVQHFVTPGRGPSPPVFTRHRFTATPRFVPLMVTPSGPAGAPVFGRSGFGDRPPMSCPPCAGSGASWGRSARPQRPQDGRGARCDDASHEPSTDRPHGYAEEFAEG